MPDPVLHSPDLLAEVLDRGGLSLAARAARTAWEGGGSVNARIRAELENTVRWFDVVGRVIRDQEGTPLGATGIVLEVTESHEASEAVVSALGEAEATLDRLVSFAGEWEPRTDTLMILRQPPGLTIVDEPPASAPLDVLLERTGRRDTGRVRDAFQDSLMRGRGFNLEVLLRDDESYARRTLIRGGPVGDPPTALWIAATVLD